MTAAEQHGAWINCAALASRIGMSKAWVQERVTAKAIPHHRVGRYVRFSPGDIAAIERSTAVTPVDRPRLRSSLGMSA